MRRLCVYCGSNHGSGERYADAARTFADLLVSADIGLVYGGASKGLMGVIADTVLAGHPQLAEACVIGYDDEIMGERIGAVVVNKPDHSVTLEEITGFLRDRGLAVFKLPEAFVCVDELPKNATGKVVRREAKALFDQQVK